ncbi:MAG: lytic transglycosylase domain-containing protein [Methylococcales bacterium]|jgi:hypothetical protein|nr:lytic transglycosylase domain-containing protein [Methylococcales bacterium]MBT7445370.1 lytic transglycosylase domain-containing protein [Methylococcales bacterium]
MKPVMGVISGVLSGFILLTNTALASSSANVESELKAALKNDHQPSTQIDFPHQACFEKAAATHKISTAMLLAVARGESDFNSKAISKANAYGLMQIQWPGTAKDLGIMRKADLFKPCVNINGGAKYLRYLLDRYKQNPYLALAAYNYGPGRIKKTDSHSSIPKGAKWYAGYINQHLSYVVREDNSIPKHNYATEQKIDILVFKQVYRAEAFVAYLKKSNPKINLAWFKKPFGEFHVVLQYSSKAEKRKGIKQLSKLGFNLS